MCFVNDCDWCASIQEQSKCVAQAPLRCDECRVTIQPGEVVHHLYQQEHEDCQTCDGGNCECPDDKCCACEQPDYGETFNYDCCDGCDKFLQAIEVSEVEEGCARSESRPALTQMIEDIREGDTPNNVRRYVKKALALFPELKASGYLTRIARKLL